MIKAILSPQKNAIVDENMFVNDFLVIFNKAQDKA